jgi:lysyl-tRNA synthetase, class II
MNNDIEGNASKRDEQSEIRFKKLDQLVQRGFNFPNNQIISDYSLDIKKFLQLPEPRIEKSFNIAGRIMLMRVMGKACFIQIQDSQDRIQLYLRKEEIGEERYTEILDFDIGDIIAATGVAFYTKTGEPTLHVAQARLLNKSLHPLPEKWHGITDVEIRYRQRYLDLICNQKIKSVFVNRSKCITSIRRYFEDSGYLEVETPVLHHIAGGADARPFKTHHNALNSDMYLRIALELPLKKLVVGGIEKVFEIGRIFRNEGLSRKHNPEFTMLEFYEAYATFVTMMDRTEKSILAAAKSLGICSELKYGDLVIDLKTPWASFSMKESIYEFGGVSRDLDLATLPDLLKVADFHNIKLEAPEDWGRSLEALWGELVEHKLINPTFITHHPTSISPLARKNENNLLITDRFELIIAGIFRT